MIVHRVREPRRPRDLGEFVTWIEHMNADMLAAGVELGDRYAFDVVHGHDWLVAVAGDHLAQPLPLPARGDDPRHRVRPPPGLGRQAPAVAHPRHRALDGQPRRPRDHLLALHARPRLRHLRPRGGAGRGDPQRDRPARPPARRRPRRRCARASPRPTSGSCCSSAGSSTRRASSSRSTRCPGLIERLGDVRFLVAGSGTHEAELKAQAQRARARWSTARSWAGSATTCCTRSTGSPTCAWCRRIYEPFGLVALEAMASGCPCIVADTGGLREVVPNDDVGLRFRSRDPELAGGDGRARAHRRRAARAARRRGLGARAALRLGRRRAPDGGASTPSSGAPRSDRFSRRSPGRGW